MRKSYLMLMTLLFTLLGTGSASAAYTAELVPEMFKAWSSDQPGATEVSNPDPEPKNNANFGVEYNLYKEVGAYGCIYGNSSVYYLWYADLTGTKTINFVGTPGMSVRLMLNREPYVEGGAGDADGGAYVEIIQKLGSDGTLTIDLSANEALANAGYIHLNAIKVPAGGTAGTMREMTINGDVKPVTGWIPLVKNSDFEGDDLSSFPVSYDGPNNGNTAPDLPEFVAGGGKDGSRCVKVTSHDAPTETWHTQFYIKLDEPIKAQSNTSWRIRMDIKADEAQNVTTSAQADPRVWKGGFIEEFTVTQEWKTYEFSGIFNAADYDLGSVAFDLNNVGGSPGGPNTFYFDNVYFDYWVEPSSLLSLKGEFYQDAIRVNFGGENNIPELVTASGQNQIVFPNENVKVTINGEETILTSAEGRPDGNLWIFIEEPLGGAQDENDEVLISFTNPEDPALQVLMTTGKNAGEPAPSFTDLKATYAEDDVITQAFSYLYGSPSLVSADPEDGSFNLPKDLKTFKFLFDQPVDCSGISATLGKEKLKIVGGEDFVKELVLERTGSGELTGEYVLSLNNVMGKSGIGDPYEHEFHISFGPVTIDPNDQPEMIIPVDYFNNCADNTIPEGYFVYYPNTEWRVPTGNYSSGARMFSFGGDFTKALYVREGYAQYGTTEDERMSLTEANPEIGTHYEDHLLSLKAGKRYNITFNTARWKSSGEWTKFEILDDYDEVVFGPEIIQNNPDVNGAQGSSVSKSTVSNFNFVPELDGNYRLRWTACDASGNQGFNEILLANVQMQYLPSTLGASELLKLDEALEKAKNILGESADERYAGAAYTALDQLINGIEAAKASYTAPSVVNKAIADLTAASEALSNHHKNCDTYDPLPGRAQEMVDQWAETKFANTDLFKFLQSVAEKYEGKVLTDDAELLVAIDELNGTINQINEMFTTGHSAVGDWSSTRTGYAVLFDRLLWGIETLQALGVAEDDAIITEANAVLGDDDEMAERLELRIKKELYSQLKEANNTLFDPTQTVDEETGEVEYGDVPSYDMTVFVKNPTLYKISDGNGYQEGAVPGWDVIDGRGFSTGWNTYGSAKVPVDVMFSNWGGSFTVSQTISDLPAGVYTLQGAYGERMSEDEAPNALDGTYFYVKTSELAAMEDSLVVECPRIGQAFPALNCEITEVVIADGIVTLGVQAGNDSHVFFDKVAIKLTAPAENVDYGKLYEQVLAGIDETMAKNATTRAIEMYDLNGRRVAHAQRGITIVKRYMSDGTVRTQKVVIK